MNLRAIFLLTGIAVCASVYGEDTLTYGRGVALGVPPAELVPEISGMVVSRDHADVVWVHNDSGDGPFVYALSLTTGELLSTAELPDVKARDWEDLAIGPGPDKRFDYLYIGDMGNNTRKADGFVVYRTPEPVVIKRTQFAPARAVAKFVETFRFSYPGEFFDAEALMVDPETKELTIVTKDHDENAGKSFVFRTDGEPKAGVVNKLLLVGDIFFGPTIRDRVTGGDFSADGRWVIVRTYREARLYRREVGERIAEAILGPYSTILMAPEPQGEAIAFDRREEFDGTDAPTVYSATELGPKVVNPNKVMRPIMRYESKEK